MTSQARSADQVDAVVIGRNEGARLVTCLNSLRGTVRRLIYVDSGSTDGSVEAARGLGAEVVELDTARPFTAARARNAGLALIDGDLGYVQFVDGDCEVDPQWIATGRAFLNEHPDAAVVCGRRRERHPDASLYNAMCDAEWDTPLGSGTACGGDAMMRVAALRAVGGYRDALIAGEEPELCVRLRAAGWSVWRIDHEMTLHDAAILRFSQWWRRTRRAGFAFAAGAALHGAPPERHWVRETQRAVISGCALPALAVLSAVFLPPFAVAILCLYPLQWLRLSRRMGTREAAFSTIGKFAEARGVLDYAWSRLSQREKKIIEYK